MRRLGGQAYVDDRRARKEEELERFPLALDRHLRALGLEADNDARREKGVVIWREIELGIHRSLTQEFLAKHGLSFS